MQLIKSRILSALLLTALSTTAISAEHETGPLACDFSAEESRMVTLKITNGDIEGAVMRLPRDYIIGVSYSGNNAVHRTGYFRVYNTDFSAYPNSELHLKNGRFKGAVGIHDGMDILISSYWPMEKLARDSISSHYGLPFNSSEVDIQGKLVEFGLYTTRNKKKKSRGDLVYFAREGNAITDVIRCSPKNPVLKGTPQCSHFFEVDAYDVKIRYANIHLSRWQELRNKTTKLLECFTIAEPTQIDRK